MRLPFAPPLAPMLSSAADALPGGEGWQFEPKWDGFRTLVFRDGDEILLQSRDAQALYVRAVLISAPPRIGPAYPLGGFSFRLLNRGRFGPDNGPSQPLCRTLP